MSYIYIYSHTYILISRFVAGIEGGRPEGRNMLDCAFDSTASKTLLFTTLWLLGAQNRCSGSSGASERSQILRKLSSGASERSKIQFWLMYLVFEATALLRHVLSNRLCSVLSHLWSERSQILRKLSSGASERSKIQFWLMYLVFEATALLRHVLSNRLCSVLSHLCFFRSHFTASNCALYDFPGAVRRPMRI